MFSAGLVVLLGTSAKKTGLLFERYRERSLRRDVPENLRDPVRSLVQVLSIDTDVALPDVPASGDEALDAVGLVHRVHLELPSRGQLRTEPAVVAQLELPGDHLSLSSPQVAARGCPRIAAAYIRMERSRLLDLFKKSLFQVVQATSKAIQVVPVQTRTIQVAVVAGLAGGTASGSVRMICDLVNEAAADCGVRDRVLVSLYTVASGAETAVNGERARANTFAQLGELYSDSQGDRQTFDWCFVVGPHDGEGQMVDWDRTFQMLAQALHMLLCTEAGPTVVGRLGDAEEFRLTHDPNTGCGKVFSTLSFNRLFLPDLGTCFGARLGCAVLDRHLGPAPTPEQSQEPARRNLRQLSLVAPAQGLRRELLQEVDDGGVARGLLDLVDDTYHQVEGQHLSVDTAISLRPARLANAVEHCRQVVEDNESRLCEDLIWRVNSLILRPVERGEQGISESCSVVKEMIALLLQRDEELQVQLQGLEDRRAQQRFRASTLRDRLLAVLNGEHGATVRRLGTRPLNAATSEAERNQAHLEVEVLSLEAERRLLEDMREHLSLNLVLLEDLLKRYSEVREALEGQAEAERGRSHAFDLAIGVDMAGNPGDFDSLYGRFLKTRDEDTAVERVLRQYGGLPVADAQALRGACAAMFRSRANVQEEFLARFPLPDRREQNLANLAALSRPLLEVNECRVDVPGLDRNPTSQLHFVGLAGGNQGPLALHLARVLGERGRQVFLMEHGSENTVDILTVRVGLPPVAIPLLEGCGKSYFSQVEADRRRGSVMSHTGRYEHLLVPVLPGRESTERAAAMGFALGSFYKNGSFRWRSGAGDVVMGKTEAELAAWMAGRHGTLAGVAAEFVDEVRKPGGAKAMVRQLLDVESQHPWLARPVKDLLEEING